MKVKTERCKMMEEQHKRYVADKRGVYKIFANRLENLDAEFASIESKHDIHCQQCKWGYKKK